MITVVCPVPELINDSGSVERASLSVAVSLSYAIEGLEIHISSFESYLREFRPPPGYPPDRHEKYEQEKRLCALLRSATGFPAEIVLPPTETRLLSGIALHAICDGAYSHLCCDLCSRTYLPSHIVVEPWSGLIRGNPHGGRTARCPEHHILSHLWEWVT
ncbi:MAG TPA: hypothetical protein VF585_08000 [Chthoniobacterales bacterium]